MAQMDLGSGILASKKAKTRVVTVAVDGMSFLRPVRVGDTVACYAWVESVGRTSMKIPVEVWVQRYMRTEQTLVTRAVFTYVAVDQNGRPVPVKRVLIARVCGRLKPARGFDRFARLAHRHHAAILLERNILCCFTRSRLILWT